MKKIISLILCLVTVLLCLGSCGGDKKAEDETTAAEISKDPIYVEMSVKDFGVMKIELYPDIAPITVTNFVKLVNEKFYDGLKFHRIVKEFMIQSGDPTATGTGGSAETITGEFSANGIENSLSHDRGVISMARNSYDMNSASSQFFIVHTDKYKSSLDGQYAAFGKVIEGLDVLDAIATVDTVMSSSGEKSVPVHDVIIDYVKVVD